MKFKKITSQHVLTVTVCYVLLLLPSARRFTGYNFTMLTVIVRLLGEDVFTIFDSF